MAILMPSLGRREGERVDAGAQEAIARALGIERARTHHRIAALTRDFDEIVERSTEASRDDEHDPEGSTIAFERAQVSALLDAAKAQLRDVEVAAQRLAAGDHGSCERCGRAIPAERHRVRPTARTCVACAR